MVGCVTSCIEKRDLVRTSSGNYCDLLVNKYFILRINRLNKLLKINGINIICVT